MFQLYKNIQTDFLGQIFLELFEFKSQSLFWDTLYIHPSIFRMVYKRLAFFQEYFTGEIYYYANFSIVFGQFFLGEQVSKGGTASGGTPFALPCGRKPGQENKQ